MVEPVNGDTSSAGPAPAATATPGEANPEDVAEFEAAGTPSEGSAAPIQKDGDPTPSSIKNFEEISARKSDRYFSETADKSGLTSLANDSNEKQFHTIFGDTLGYDPKNETSSEYKNAESLRGAIKNKDWENAGLRLASANQSELGGRAAAFSGGDTPDTSDDTIVVDESTLNKPEKLYEGIEAELFHAFERGVHGDKSGDVQLGKDGPVFDDKDKHEPLDEGELGRRALNQWNESGSTNVESLVVGDKAINRDDHFSITDTGSNTQRPISLEGGFIEDVAVGTTQIFTGGGDVTPDKPTTPPEWSPAAAQAAENAGFRDEPVEQPHDALAPMSAANFNGGNEWRDPDLVKYQPSIRLAGGVASRPAVDQQGDWNAGLSATGNSDGDPSKQPYQGTNIYGKVTTFDDGDPTTPFDGHPALPDVKKVLEYAVYMPKDHSTNGISGGHRHDWEGVAVLLGADGEPIAAGASAHGHYSDIRQPLKDPAYFTDDNRPKVVYTDKDFGTHSLKFTKDGGSYNSNELLDVGAPIFPNWINETLEKTGWGNANYPMNTERSEAAITEMINLFIEREPRPF